MHENYGIKDFDQMRMNSTIVHSRRGLLMYLKKDKKFSVPTMTQLPYLEICQCDIQYRDTMLCVLGLYRPPSSSLQKFKEELFRYISACGIQSKKVIVGDFNINVHGSLCHSFLQEMQQKFHLKQFVNKPTTFEGTTIDLVFSNLPDVSVVVLASSWSSHYTLNISVPR